jgi:hypothetical protein
MVWPDSLVTQYQMDADSANPGEELNERSLNSTDNGITDISNNAGSVKLFLSRLVPSFLRVVFLVFFDAGIDDHGSFVIYRADSVRPKHLFDPYFESR